MPTLTYPGVYIEELPSAVHTITGVATSIAAFVGWAPMGSVTEATLVQSWSDFQNQFGGLNPQSTLGYAVNQFFGNGGQQAYIVRTVWDASFAAAPGTYPTPAATASVSGIGNSTATITANFNGVTGSTMLSVGAPTLNSIVLTPSHLTLPEGMTQKMTATGIYSDGSQQDLTSSVTWSPSSNSPATVSNTGLVTAATPGTANITAAVGTIQSSASVTVTTEILQSITITPLSQTIQPGTTLQFTAIGHFSSGTQLDLTSIATWTPTTTGSAVQIDPATGLASCPATETAGATATVTATYPPPIPPAPPSAPAVKSNIVTLTVGAALHLIAVQPASLTVPLGASVQFKAIGTYTDNSTADLTAIAGWTSTGMTINSSGLATSNTSGSATVQATVGSLNSTATITITSALPTAITVTPANPTVAVNKTVQFSVTGTYPDGTTQNLTGATWASSSSGVASFVSSSSPIATGVGTAGGLTLYASSPGQWANGQSANPPSWVIGLNVAVKVSTSDPTRFSLSILNSSGNTLESFANLSTNPHDPQGRYVVTVIDNDSQYVTFINPAALNQPPTAPNATPNNTLAPVPLSGGADGTPLTPATDGNFEIALGVNPPATAYGVHLLDRVDIFNLLCVPGETDSATIPTLQEYCATKRAFYIVDCPQNITTASIISSGPAGTASGSNVSLPHTAYSSYSAYYYPWVLAPDPLFGNRPTLFPPCGFVAGLYAATDASRGVWKAPAGIDAGLSGVSGLQVTLTDLENGSLNPQAVNCLRQFKVYGDVVWGARTLDGNDQIGSQWKYVPIRRLAMYIETSLYDGTQWVVFEPNDQPLWSQIRLNVGAFMQGLFMQGAFQGNSPQQAYFVKCDSENNPQSSIDLGIVNILVGFAPLYPAEFVVIQIQQMAGQV
jgi:phage tail sheath protein FI